MRRLNIARKKEPLQVVKELDAFPKIPESYKETTANGGGISIVTFLLIIILVVSEFVYYSDTDFRYEYEVDAEYDKKMKINIDMTIAMKCDQIGADVVDVTGQNTESFGELDHEPAHFALSPLQEQYQATVDRIHKYIRTEYIAVHEILWRTGYSGMSNMMPAREVEAEGDPDACRVHGSLVVSKVAGNFHITAGKSVPVYPAGHAHLAVMIAPTDYNFSHRIDHFSFGDYTPGVVNPLDGDLKVVTDNYHMFQYFVEIVPTKVDTKNAKVDTYQYAATEKNRTINHHKGSHGIPGIFVKYDVSSLKIHVKEEYKPIGQFIIRLCGIIGGVFATSGLINTIIEGIINVICCRKKEGNNGNQAIPVHTLTTDNTSTDPAAFIAPPSPTTPSVPVPLS